MITDNLCLPALLYLGFTLIHIVIDLFNKMYNSALLKFIQMIIFTTILNLLCRSGLTVLSWIIVFLPFILLTVITVWLLISLGLSPGSGYLEYNVKDDETEQSETEQPETPRPETPQPETPQPETPQPETEQPDTEQPDTDEINDVVVENMFNIYNNPFKRRFHSINNGLYQ